MVYRRPDHERKVEEARQDFEAWRERASARTRHLAAGICRIDAAIGEWAARLPDGVPAPPPVLALMAEKKTLEDELRGLSTTFTSTYLGPPLSAGGPGPRPSLWRRMLGWLRYRP